MSLKTLAKGYIADLADIDVLTETADDLWAYYMRNKSIANTYPVK